MDHLIFEGGGVEDLREKVSCKAFTVKKSCNTNGYEKNIHAQLQKIVVTTSQWEKEFLH